jgi:hypothetical protein
LYKVELSFWELRALTVASDRDSAKFRLNKSPGVRENFKFFDERGEIERNQIAESASSVV